MIHVIPIYLFVLVFVFVPISFFFYFIFSFTINSSPSHTFSSLPFSLSFDLFFTGLFIPDFTAYLLSDTVRILRINVNSPEASNVSISLRN